MKSLQRMLAIFITALIITTSVLATPMQEEPLYSSYPTVIIGEDIILLTNFGEVGEFQLKHQPKIINNKFYVPAEVFQILFPDKKKSEVLSRVHNTAYSDGDNMIFFSKDSTYVERFDHEFEIHKYELANPTIYNPDGDVLYIPIHDVFTAIEDYSAYEFKWDNQLKTLTIKCDPNYTTHKVLDTEVH